MSDSRQRIHCEEGFTLVEMMLSVSLIALIAILAVPALFSIGARTDFDAALMNSVSALRRAEMRARFGIADSPWGIRVESGTLILFSGPSYTTRDPDLDEIVQFPSGVSASGLAETVFSKLRGEPSAVGNIDIAVSSGREAHITVSPKGVINYAIQN